jgi:hypothetical protein
VTEESQPARPDTTPDERGPDEPAQHGNRLGGWLDWLPATPAILALAGAVLPWFAPTGAGQGGGLQIAAAYCWQAGRIGFLAPLVLLIAAVAVVGPRQGWFAKGEVRTYRHDATLLIAAGAAAGVVLALTWWLLPKSYTFSAGLTWDSLVSLGYHIARNPQPGYFVTIVGAVDAVACGIVYLVTASRRAGAESSDDASAPAGKIDNHDGADPERHSNPGRDQG